MSLTEIPHVLYDDKACGQTRINLLVTCYTGRQTEAASKHVCVLVVHGAS